MNQTKTNLTTRWRGPTLHQQYLLQQIFLQKLNLNRISMAAFTPQGASLLLGWRRPGRFTKGLGQKMPAAYKKFWDEWKVQKPAPVHFVPQAAGEVYRRSEHTGQVKLNQNVPIPLMSVPEEHAGKV